MGKVWTQQSKHSWATRESSSLPSLELFIRSIGSKKASSGWVVSNSSSWLVTESGGIERTTSIKPLLFSIICKGSSVSKAICRPISHEGSESGLGLEEELSRIFGSIGEGGW